MSPSRGRDSSILFAATLSLLLASPGRTDDHDSGRGEKYRFTKVADSFEDGFDPFSFECLSMNNRGDIAFRTARVPEGGDSLIQGIYRSDRDDDGRNRRRLTTIAEFGGGFDFLGRIPSINDDGEVAFAVSQFSFETGVEGKSIMRGDGRRLRIVARAGDDFSNFEPTINDADVVAFKAETNEIDTFDFENGLFRGGSAP